MTPDNLMRRVVIRFVCVVLMLAPVLAQAPKNWTTAEDHQDMMAQLGIRKLRPGPSGNESAPNQANYDESRANPFPALPDVLTLKSGAKVATAAVWWKQRRPEIVEDFEREVLGRVPNAVSKVTWTVVATTETTIAHARDPNDPRISDTPLTTAIVGHGISPKGAAYR